MCFTTGVPTSSGFSPMSFPCFLCLVILNRSLFQCLFSLSLNPPQYASAILFAKNTSMASYPLPNKPPLVAGLNLTFAVFFSYPQFLYWKSWLVIYPQLSHTTLVFAFRHLYFIYLLCWPLNSFSRLKRPCCSSDMSCFILL